VQQSEEPPSLAAESTANPAPAETAPPPPEEPAPVNEEVAEEDLPAKRGVSPKRVGSWAKKTGAELQAQVSGLFRKKRGPEEEPDPEVDDLDEEVPEPEELDRDEDEEAPLAIAEDPPEPEHLDEDEEAALAIVEAAPERRWRYQQKTVFGTRKRSGAFGVYGAWTGIQTGFGTGPVDTNGLELGAVLGSRLVLGGALYSTGGFAGGSHDARFFYGGLHTGWIFGSHRLLHPRADLLIGSGAMWDQDTGIHMGSATVIVPRVGLELNVSRAFRVAGSVGYRHVAAPGEAGKALSAPEMGLTLRFGWM
ncbi:MAG: hypothetical protein JRI25_07235, partial [Deltaproteobacteria bacterium]|nr:hypothetical protein [Deltaproteobacteria bacterium]